MIDMHNHVLIDVDDGPGTTKDAIALIRQAVDNGITDIIATPHHGIIIMIHPHQW